MRRRTLLDARMYAVRITPEGKSVLEKAGPIAQKVDAAVLTSLSASERETFNSLLGRLCRNRMQWSSRPTGLDRGRFGRRAL